MATTASSASAHPPARIAANLARTAPIPAGARSALLMEHGAMKLRYYQPRGVDPQTPHDQDEVYFVVKGRGEFVCDTQRHAFEPGDVLFARAHAVHRFERFSDDLELWVVFYGPKGGEATG
jgi:mannose-6-phosphate isomerase-like protein (cupin superfamily)